MTIPEKNTVRRARTRLLPGFLALIFLLLSIPQDALAASFSAIVTSDSMTIYSNAALSKKSGSLPKDSVVVVTAYKDGVAYITYRANGNKGYARASDMAAVKDAGEKATVMVSGARVYGAAKASGKYYACKKGMTLYVLSTSGDWARVENGGYIGYTYINNLSIGTQTTETPAPTEAPAATATPNPLKGFSKLNKNAVTVADGIPVYELPDTASTKIGTMDKDTTVKVGAYTKEWAYIELNGKAGFAPLSGLIPDPPVKVETLDMAAKANTTLYSAALSTSEKLRAIAKGEALTLYAYNKTWAFVKGEDGVYGYVLCSKITAAKATATAPATPTPEPTVAPTETIPAGNGVVVETVPVVTTKKVTVYKSASTSSAKMGTMNVGSEMTMLARSKNWAYVTLDDKYGYCALSALSAADEAATPTPTPAPTPSPTPSLEEAIPAVVTASSMAVYKSANTASKKLGTLKKGAEVNVIAYGTTWAYIELNGNFGYSKVKSLTKVADLEPTPSPTPGNGTVQFEATVIYPNAPVYQSQSATGDSTSLSAGTAVSVYAYDTKDGWAYIGKDSARGYMHIQHLNRDSYSAMSSGSSGSGVLALQKALETLGYFDGLPAGNYSSLTEQAVSRFQSAVGLPSTGNADVATQRVLASGYAPASPLLSQTLSDGSKGSNVERLQVRLYYKGYLTKTASVDGDFGSTTTSAVKLFQSTAGLSVSGKADPTTLKALYSSSAPKNGSTAPDAGGSSGGDQAGGSGGDSTLDKLPSNPSRAEKIEYVIYVGQQQLGKRYVYGATGPNTFDCSGFTTYCYKTVGVSMGRTAYAQGYNAGTKISGLSSLQRGDIVCLDTVSDSDLSDHVGIYLGGGQFIHASSGGGKVIISTLNSGYYNRAFSWGRRVL